MGKFKIRDYVSFWGWSVMSAEKRYWPHCWGLDCRANIRVSAWCSCMCACLCLRCRVGRWLDEKLPNRFTCPLATKEYDE